MIALPIVTSGHKSDLLLIILDDASIGRMAKADPAVVEMSRLPEKLVNPVVVICHEHDSKELTDLINSNDIEGIFEFVRRGFAFRPDLGDHDNGPQKLSDSN